MKLFPQPKYCGWRDGYCHAAIEADLRIVDQIPPQSYQIEIMERQILIEAGDDAGLSYAQQIIEQIREQSGEEGLPCCLIKDQPDFLKRGYMLDVSRDRVPTMAHLFHLVDLLAKLRYNELQLYTEHTFAYSKHKTVWANASPITADEIRILDDYCGERLIELVPNQNSFGHMERWLKHAGYHHLAECPEGFIHPLSGRKPCGSVLKPSDGTLAFLDGLYAELLPNFASQRFNIGGDEPWDLGQGWSAGLVQEHGKHAVYSAFLKRICELAERHGRQPMVWADVLLEHPEFIDELPAAVTPILWGYEADHPFEEQTAILARLGRPYYIAPGDSTWNSFTGRHATMVANVQAAASAGLKNGASGFLMTHWGDNGHLQPWVTSLPGLVVAGLVAWNAAAFKPSELAEQLGFLVLGDVTGRVAGLLLEMADVDKCLPLKIHNQSFLSASLRLSHSILGERLQTCEAHHFELVLEKCSAWSVALGGIEADSISDSRILDELRLEIGLIELAAKRCLAVKVGLKISSEALGLDELIKRYEEVWRGRSREGGLNDSAHQLRVLASA